MVFGWKLQLISGVARWKKMFVCNQSHTHACSRTVDICRSFYRICKTKQYFPTKWFCTQMSIVLPRLTGASYAGIFRQLLLLGIFTWAKFLLFSVLFHKDLDQVVRLLRAIYRPQNYYCLHLDKKAPAEMHQIVDNLTSCFDNVWDE